jgi:hypothetical protein
MIDRITDLAYVIWGPAWLWLSDYSNWAFGVVIVLIMLASKALRD